MESAPELVQMMERLFRSWAARDHPSLTETITRSPGALVIGTDPEEWWEEAKDFAAVLQIQWQETPPFTFEFGEIVAWREGTVGWGAARFLIDFEGMPPIPLRATMVFHEEGTYWRIVQWHNSVAVANEELLGVELTTTVEQLLGEVQDEKPPVSAMATDGSVTIVFTDIENSTALMEALGEERWLELLQWHDHAVRQQTTLFGGSVVKGQGDGFMLAFPAAGSATACAMAIQRALSMGWDSIPVPVRIGMHSGNAKAEAGDFFGRTVVIAARIAGAAAGGEILASQVVQQDLSGALPLGGERSLDLKGLIGRHAAFPVLWR